MFGSKHCRLQVREQGTASVAGSCPSKHALCAVLPDVPPPTSAIPTVSRHSPLQRQTTAVTTTTLVRMAVTATVTAMRVSEVVPSSW